MKRIVITLALIASMAFPGSTATANDLIKALAALQRAGSRHDLTSRRGINYTAPAQNLGIRSTSFRHGSAYRPTSQDFAVEAARLRAAERAEYQRRLQRIAELERLQRLEQTELARQRAIASHRVRYQEPLLAPPPTGVPVLPNRHPGFIPPAPTIPGAGAGRPGIPVPRIPAPRHRHHDFAFGDIVDCPVPLYTRLRIRDRHNIAPGARPMVVAVKAPGSCDHACSCCADEIVFVRVLAPPCEPRCVKVSPCGRHVRMDFGKYEIDIVSMSNLVKVDYDN